MSKFVYPKHTYQDVKNVFENYIHDKDAIAKIDDAYAFAEAKHANQFRKSGEPYIIHVIEVAYILATNGVGPNTIMAGLLHDVEEDCGITNEEIATRFNPEVATLVESVTKIASLDNRKDREFLAESHRKIFIAMARDIRVIIIKLADRLHNMRTLEFMEETKQQRIAKETLEVYAPIAHRIGMSTIKTELENLSLYYLEREKYIQIEELLNTSSSNRKKNMILMQKKIAEMLHDKKLNFDISSRVKSIYSIYKKMYVKGRKFEEIYDIMAMRIIVDTEVNCYEALGYIHSIYKPVPGRFKDYIAMPKPNMYQSLHTTIVAPDGNIYEIQIRTHEMDEIAEGGVAAHWRYKEGTKYDQKKEQKEIEEQLHWLNDFKSLESENKDASDYMYALQRDIFDANVYVFTPQGRVIDLPNGATPLDFAYKIHTKVGDSAVGATINGILVPLSTPLKTGDVCEIKTSDNSFPNEGWLNIVKTNFAKNRIKKLLAKRNEEVYRDENIAKGLQMCKEEFGDYNYNEKQMLKLFKDNNVLEHYNCKDYDDLFAMVANKSPLPIHIIEYLGLKKISQSDALKNYIDKNTHKIVKSASNQSILVAGTNNVKVNVSPCCSPLPGDRIIGYVSRGKGIKVHRAECPNVENETRLIQVLWNPEVKEESYPVNIIISANDRNNLIVDILNLFSQVKVPCQKINAKLHSSNMTVTISCTVMLKNVEQMQDVFNHLMNVESVYEVKRVLK